MPEFLAQLSGASKEACVLERKWRRGFEPHEQIGMLVGRLEAQLFDVVEIVGVLLIPRRGIVIDLGEIELYRAGVVIGANGRDKSRREQNDRDEGDERGDEHGHTSAERSFRCSIA